MTPVALLYQQPASSRGSCTTAAASGATESVAAVAGRCGYAGCSSSPASSPAAATGLANIGWCAGAAADAAAAAATTATAAGLAASFDAAVAAFGTPAAALGCNTEAWVAGPSAAQLAMEDLVATAPPAVKKNHSSISSSSSAGQAGSSRQQPGPSNTSASQQDEVEATATANQQLSPVGGTASRRLRARKPVPAQQHDFDESADSDGLAGDAAPPQHKAAMPDVAASLQPAAGAAAPQQQPVGLLDQLLQLQGGAAMRGAALGQPALLQQLLGQPMLGGALGQLQMLAYHQQRQQQQLQQAVMWRLSMAAQDEVEATATANQQLSPVGGTASRRLRARKPVPAQQHDFDESADSDGLAGDAAPPQHKAAMQDVAASMQPAAGAAAPQQQPVGLLDQLLQLQGGAAMPGAALGQPALLQQLLGQPMLGGALGQLQMLQQLLQPVQQPQGLQLPLMLQLLQQLLGQPVQASPLQQLVQIQGLLQGAAGQPAVLGGLSLPAALGLGSGVAAPAANLATPAANMQSPVSPSTARGSAQFSSSKKQRVGRAGLLAQQEVVEVAVRPGRQNKTLSDTSDDDYLPGAVQQLQQRQQKQQQQQQQQQVGVSSAAAAAAAAAGSDVEAQHGSPGASTRVVYKVLTTPRVRGSRMRLNATLAKQKARACCEYGVPLWRHLMSASSCSSSNGSSSSSSNRVKLSPKQLKAKLQEFRLQSDGNAAYLDAASCAGGSAQFSSSKKQRVGRAGLLAQQEVVEVAVRPGRQNKTLSDTSDDDYLPGAVQQLQQRQQRQQQQQQQHQVGVSLAAAAAVAAAGSDVEAQHGSPAVPGFGSRMRLNATLAKQKARACCEYGVPLWRHLTSASSSSSSNGSSSSSRVKLSPKQLKAKLQEFRLQSDGNAAYLDDAE
eukprot:jgi/Sobl393_1/19650/SZX69229.1